MIDSISGCTYPLLSDSKLQSMGLRTALDRRCRCLGHWGYVKMRTVSWGSMWSVDPLDEWNLIETYLNEGLEVSIEMNSFLIKRNEAGLTSPPHPPTHCPDNKSTERALQSVSTVILKERIYTEGKSYTPFCVFHKSAGIFHSFQILYLHLESNWDSKNDFPEHMLKYQ